MNLIQHLLKFYITGSIHVALGVVSLTALTMLHLGLEFDGILLNFVFFGTVTGYNFVKYAGVAKLHHRSLAENLKYIQIFSIFCFLALCYYAYRIKAEVLVIAGALGVFTLLYALPVLKRKRNLRDIAGVKIFVIALIWAGVTVFFPVVNSGLAVETYVILEFCQRFLFVMVLILPFEIRDLKYDSKSLNTIPQKLGVRKTKQLGYLLILFWIIIEFTKEISTGNSKAALLFAATITTIALYRTTEDQSPYFSSFWVEGIPILWFLLLLLFEMT